MPKSSGVVSAQPITLRFAALVMRDRDADTVQRAYVFHLRDQQWVELEFQLDIETKSAFQVEPVHDARGRLFWLIPLSHQGEMSALVVPRQATLVELREHFPSVEELQNLERALSGQVGQSEVIIRIYTRPQVEEEISRWAASFLPAA